MCIITQDWTSTAVLKGSCFRQIGVHSSSVSAEANLPILEICRFDSHSKSNTHPVTHMLNKHFSTVFLKQNIGVSGEP